MAENPSGTRAPERPGYIEVLRECPDFRLLFFARTIGLLGDWFRPSPSSRYCAR